MNQYPAAGLASLVAAQGQGPDTTLVHMTQDEVRALQDMARAQGYELPLNPVTGLPQAGFLSDFLSTIGRGISTVARTAIQNPQTTALLTGAAYGAIKGDLQKGLEAGMKAYAGTQILGGLTSLGRGTVPTPTETKPGAPRSEAEQKPTETGGAPTPSKPAAGTVRTTVQQPGGLDAVLRNILGGGQPGTTQQGQQGVFGAARDPIMEFIKLYAINKAGQKMGQDKYMPKPEPVQYRDVDFSYGQVNPRFGEPGQPYFIGGGYTDRGITTQYPGLRPPATTPQQGQAPPGQPPPNIPSPARSEPIEFYRPPQTQPGYSMAGGGIVPRPNPNFPMSRVQDNGYEVSVDAYTGEEKFAEGGVADTEEERRRKYFENLRPFAPALTDLYRGTPSTGGESAQGDTYLRETDPLTGLTTGAPKVVGTGIDSLRPYDPNLADWYKSLLNPPVGREPVDMGDYYKTTPFRAQTQYGDVTPYPIPTGPTPPPPPPPPPSQTRTCPPGTKNAGKEYNPLDFLTGGDPCGGLVGQCGANEFRNPASGECECNAGFERGPDGVCKGKGTGTKTCADGSTVPADQECPTGDGFKTCADGTRVRADQECPTGDGFKTCADGTRVRADQDCPTGDGFKTCADGTRVRADQDCPTGEELKTCPDGSKIPVSQECPKGPVTPEDCTKVGLIYDPNRALAGLYPCVPEVKKYKCDDGREVDDPKECSYDCAPGAVYVKDRGCICTNTDRPPDPEFGCEVRKGGSVTPEDCFKQGLSYDPIKAAAGLYPCFKEDGDDGEDGCKDPNAEPNTVGECVCKSGYKLDANGKCAKSSGDDGGGGAKCDANETQVGEVCYGRCPDGMTYTRGVSDEKPCREQEDKTKRCPDGSVIPITERCPTTPTDIPKCEEGYELDPGMAAVGMYVCVPIDKPDEPKKPDDCLPTQIKTPGGKCVNKGTVLFERNPDGSCPAGTTDVDGDYCGAEGGIESERERRIREREGGGGGGSSGVYVPGVETGGMTCYSGAGYEGTICIPSGGSRIKRSATGGIIEDLNRAMKKKRAKKYQTGGIAGLNRTRMGAAVNPADGYNFGFAKGGLPSLPEYRAGGKLLRGPGDGMSDDIPAVIRGKGVQRAALADGEFVIPADVVSHLGNGSTEAGAKKLYKMMAQIRAARTGKKKQAPQVNADKYLPRV